MRKLYFGQSGEDVKQLQTKLEQLGYADFLPTTFFGIKTHLALRRFQADNHIPTTGVFGETEYALMGFKTTLSNSEQFFNVAMTCIGKDITPKDEVPDEVACMQTIDTICFIYSGHYLSGNEITISTLKGYLVLRDSPKWKIIPKPEKGCLVIYPSGFGNGNLTNGHIFVSDGAGKLYSNVSASGLFMQNYTDYTASQRYELYGGYPRFCFKLI